MIAIDIETVPDEERIKSRQWAEYKEKKGITDDQDAALLPAFGRVVCICAYDRISKQKLKACGTDEAVLLMDLDLFLSDNAILGGHNIKGFDIPFLSCRYLANEITLPKCLRVAGKKPWDVQHIDTIELMKFGGGQYISLDAMCLMLGVKSPKEGEVSGLGVWQAYKDGRMDQIEAYCSMDVNAWLQCIRIIETMGAC